MAKTPVVMKIQDYKDREVQMVTYEFDQETDREGQMTGIPPRTDGLDVRPLPEERRINPVPRDQDPEGDEGDQVLWRLLRRLRGEVGRQGRPL